MKRLRVKPVLFALTLGMAVGIPAAALGLDADSTGTVDTGVGTANGAPVPLGYTGINDPALIACMQAKKVCNPAAEEVDPLSDSAGSGLTIGDASQALALARTSTHAASTAPGGALSMTGTQAQQFTGETRRPTIDESRPVWVVTVATPVWTDGSPARPAALKEAYSAIVDAGSGEITDECIGCAWVATK